MAVRFLHTSLHVSSLEGSLEVYRAALGFEEGWRRVISPEEVLVFLALPGNTVQLELSWQAQTPPVPPPSRRCHLAVSTDLLPHLYARHAAMGCVAATPEPGSLYFVRDPDGYYIEVLDQNRPLPPSQGPSSQP